MKLTKIKLKEIISEDIQKLGEGNNFYVIAKRNNAWVIFNTKELNDSDAYKLHTRLEKAKIPSVKQIEVVDRNQLKNYKLKPLSIN